jgi:hypothetical protein
MKTVMVMVALVVAGLLTIVSYKGQGPVKTTQSGMSYTLPTDSVLFAAKVRHDNCTTTESEESSTIKA